MLEVIGSVNGIEVMSPFDVVVLGEGWFEDRGSA